MRTAVVGHIEWVEFLRVARLPGPGEIAHATEWWEAAAGGGAGAAAQLAKLTDDTILFTALGDDDIGRRAARQIADLGVRVEVAWRAEPTRRAVTHVDRTGERTITVVGDRLAPLGADALAWDELGRVDAVYVTAGDVAALRAARSARVVVATARVLPLLRSGAVPLDAVVGSAVDPAEQFAADDLDPPPALAVWTDGERGGTWSAPGEPRRRFDAPPLTAPVVDRYGAGDSFAGGLTYALGAGLGPDAAIAVAARCGAAALTGRGPYEGQIGAASLDDRA